MCQRTDHLAQRIWALSSLGPVKSRGTQRATRIWAVSTCVFNMHLLSSRSLFCHVRSTEHTAAVQGASGEMVEQKGGGEGWRWRTLRGWWQWRRQKEQEKLNVAHISLDGQQKRLQSHNTLPSVPDQNPFLTCFTFIHSTRKHPKGKKQCFLFWTRNLELAIMHWNCYRLSGVSPITMMKTRNISLILVNFGHCCENFCLRWVKVQGF